MSDVSNDRDMRLAQEIASRWPTHGDWAFDYMYPGFFRYYSDRLGCSVFFTPDFNEEGALDMQLQDDVGNAIDNDVIPYAFVKYQEPLTADFMHDEVVKALALVDAYYMQAAKP